MKRIKYHIRRLLLWLLKLLNMPKSFNELTYLDLRSISRIIEDNVPILEVVPHNRRFDIITDKSGAIAIIEYKQAPAITIIPPDLNNPDYSINIDKNFDVVIVGFNSDDKDYVVETVKRYLRNNKFIS